jgi:hypothetical protein
MTIKALALMALLYGTVSALPDGDRVSSLSQMPDISFGLFSGYIPVEGTKK